MGDQLAWRLGSAPRDPVRQAASRATTRARCGSLLGLAGRLAGACLPLLLLLVSPAGRSIAEAAECGGARKCRCGDHVVVDYTLTEDLGPCENHGLRVRRAVLLDGAGHLVRGSGTRGSFGVQVDSKGSGARIRNLGVTGFERGVRLVKAERVRLEAVAAHDNGDRKARVGYGIDLAGGASRNVLERVQVFGNADEGIHLGSGAHENRIVDSEIYDNSRENVYMLRNHGNVLARSTLRGAGSAAVYIKHAARTVLEGNRIDGAVVHVRGASRDTRLIDNVLRDSAVVLQRYRDKDAKIGTQAPVATTISGGRIVSNAACVRVEGASETVLDGVALECPQQVSIADATVTAVATRIADVRCAGPGVLERARRIEVRFVDAGGQPVPAAELRRGEGGAMIGVANAKGIYSGLVVESSIRCPGGVAQEAIAIVVEGGGRVRKVSVAELRGDVRL